ncbi:MAG: UMP kinase [Candidatus Auribacter fodinae]|uniref:Uridylate kinase n=1 Tax=Candidatus Auribacter fodinae TaxID=2093366 RepID=A0A3A4R2P4_9BACT|nr:MAG: UMP kinase [Candidatus Auribacter fodinae]
MTSGGARPAFKRVLLKLSGEVLKGSQSAGIDVSIIEKLAVQIKEVNDLGVELALVVGGGNIFRGISVSGNSAINRVTGDYMGMLATAINGLALQNVLEHFGVPARVLTALEMGQLVEPFILRKTLDYLASKKVVIFVAGTGNPFFSTDTAAALRASEIGADVIFKATKVDGVYSADPAKDSKAVLYKELTYSEVLNKQLKVMDSTAISLCMDNRIPIAVFNINKEHNIKNAVLGKDVGTIIRG